MAKLSSSSDKKKNGDGLVNLDNQFVEAFIKDGNIVALKLLFYIAGLDIKSKDIKSQFFKISIKLSDMVTRTGVSERSFKRNLIKMQNTTISLIDEKMESYIALLPRIDYDLKGSVVITMDRDVYALVKKSESNLTIIDSKRVYQLKGKHTAKMLILLEWISGFDTPRKLFTLEELNALFGTRYTTAKDFKNNVLLKCQKELDENSKLTFTFDDKRALTIIGKGRPRVVGFWINPIGKRSYQPKLIKE